MRTHILQDKLKKYMKKLRNKTKNEQEIFKIENKNILFLDERKGFYCGKYVERLVIFLKGSGCSHVKESGGCTFCGFYNATNMGEKICDEDYIMQFNTFLGTDLIERYKIICIYNDGSLLNENEMSFKVLLYIIEKLNLIFNIEKITIESRINDIEELKLKKIRELTNKKIEIAVGFESANSEIRNLCINKSFENLIFEKTVEIAKKFDINMIPLLMVKPPFLTEREAIKDIVKSLIYLEAFNFERIDIELPTVEKGTLTNELWKRKLYKPLNLWSIIYLIRVYKKIGLKTRLYFSPMVYSVDSIDKAFSCKKCNSLILKKLEKYNEFLDEKVFENINCNCKNRWKNLFFKKIPNLKNIKNRVEETLEKLEDS